MDTLFANNPDYVEYESLLRELHRLIAADKGDDDEADVVRDAMDAPEQRLTQEEIMRLNGLSADLYMLQEDEVYEPYKGTQKELLVSQSNAWEQGRYETLLGLLRKKTSFLTPSRLAYLRGRCYGTLGHLDTALLFLRYAVEHDPDQATYRVALLDTLLKLRRADDALAEAETYLRLVEEPSLLAA